MKEVEIQRSILDYLRWTGYCAWRNQQIPVPIRRGRAIIGLRKADPYTVGLPDIFVLLPPHGRLLGIEVKRENGKQSIEQQEWEGRLNGIGAKYIVARSLDDVISALQEITQKERIS